MAFLFGNHSAPTNAQTPNYTGIQLQSSAYGIPVAVVYGATRIGWNLTDYVNFNKVVTPQKSGGKGGVVGGGGKGGGGSTVTYSASVLGTLCEGPIAGVNSSWTSQTQNVGTPGFDIIDGTIAQSPWAYLSTAYPSHALTYSGWAQAAAENLGLGSSANLPNMNWEVMALLYNTAPGTYGGNGCLAGGDADPSQVLPDMLSNAQYGIGFPASMVGQVNSADEAHVISGNTAVVNHGPSFLYNINCVIGGQTLKCVPGGPQSMQFSFDSTTGTYHFNSAQNGQTVNIRYVWLSTMATYQSFCLASGLWISPAYVNQTQMSSLIDDIAKATYSEVIWSSGVLQMIPRGTVALNANGYTYTPNTTPLFSLTDDDFMANTGSAASVGSSASSAAGAASGGGSSDDPVSITRIRKSDQINNIKIECLDRANQYATAIVEVSDAALIDRFGRRGGSTQSLHLFCDVNAANVSAHLQLQDQSILNMYSFQLDERFCILDPMDLVEATDPNFPGLTNVGVRILDLVENDDGSIGCTAEEYPGTLGQVPQFNIDTGQGLIQNFNVAPGDALTPAIFDVPVQLANVIGLETWLATCSETGNPNWGGCDVYLSTDNATYAKIATLSGPSRIGTLTANLPSGSDPDTTNTLSIDLTESQGQIEGGTQNDADTATTLCFVDGEYLSYQQATLTSTYHYNLGCNGAPSTGYLRRGQWGSSNSNHLAGSLFVRMDDNIVRIPYTKADIGRTIYIKLASFNIFGGGYQDLSEVTAYTHVIGGPPTIYAPQSLTVTAAKLGLQLNWVNAPNVGIAAVEIWRSADSTFAHATHIADAGSYATQYNDQTAVANTQYWYWIRCRDISGNEGLFDPTNAGAGATNTVAQVNTGDIANNAITNPLIAPGAVDASSIASGAVLAVLLAESLNAVQVASSLPANNANGNVVFLTTDKQLYRWDSGSSSWTVAVPGVNITAASIDITKFAAGITPVQVVTSLPAVTTANNGQVATLSTDGKLYRVVAGAWTPAVAAVDITGTITAGQIAANAIDITKFAAGITPVQIVTSLPAVTGANNGQFAWLSTDGKLYRVVAGAWTKAVDGGDLIANSVTTGSIAAAAITATQIAAGAISASKMFIGSVQNLILDANLADIAYWTALSGAISFDASGGTTWGTLSRLKFAATSGNGATSKIISCQPGDSLLLSAYLGSDNSNTGGNLIAVFYDTSGSQTSTSTVQTGTINSTPAQFSGTVTVPAGSFGIALQFKVTATSTGNAYMGGPAMYARMTGSLIVDGAITAAKIGAGEITAGKIAANAVTAGTIAANAVTAGTIAANAVTTATIAAGAVNATQIAAGAVSASKMFIGSVDNLILDSNINDLSYWGAWPGGCSLSVITPGGSWNTRNVLLATQSSASNSYAGLGTKKIACNPGDQFYASCAGGTSGQTATGTLQMEWYDNTGAGLSNTTIQAQTITGGPYSFSGTATAPAGAYYFDLFFYVGVVSNGDAATFTSPVVNRRADGNLVVDGAISALKLAANAVTAGKIDTNAITAGTIAVGAVNATAIVVNSIIVTGHLVSNAVSNSYGTTLGSYSVPGTGTWYQIGYLTVNLDVGTNVLVSMSDYITWNTNGPRGYYQIQNPGGTVIGQIGYGGGSCPDFINTAFDCIDTAGYTGYQNYYLYIYWQAGNTPTSNGATMHATELKR